MTAIAKMKTLRINCMSKLGAQLLSRFSTSTSSLQQKGAYQSKQTVDSRELENFSNLSDNWWSPEGDMMALHLMNPLRIQFIRDGLANVGFEETIPSRPLHGIKLLDVGCGGGILSEPLARIGADVTGLDACRELIEVANEHAELDKGLVENLRYLHTSIEDFAEDNREAFDAVVASEILEHVIDQELFLRKCTEVLKPRGSIFVTTINKNTISWLAGIVGAEYMLRIVPPGTHDWNKFITPEDTKRILEKFNCKTKLVHGLLFNPMFNYWSWSSSTLINYALHAVKTEIAVK